MKKRPRKRQTDQRPEAKEKTLALTPSQQEAKAPSPAPSEALQPLPGPGSKLLGVVRQRESFGRREAWAVVRGPERLPEVKLDPTALGCPEGFLVRFELETHLDTSPLRGHLLEILGDPEDPDVAIQSIIEEYALPSQFPAAVQKEIQGMAAELDEDSVQEALKQGRLDLRDLFTLTIDGQDTRDIDDALSIESLADGGRHLWVHIADVAAYVSEDSALDLEARRRGNSVYLVGQVLPMLPPVLSNGLCSLNPGATRLALSVRLDYDAAGRLRQSEVFESLIISKLRADYETVQRLFDYWDQDGLGEEAPSRASEPSLDDIYPEAQLSLKALRHLAQQLARARSQAGQLEFSSFETKIELGPQKEVLAVYPREQQESNRLIEQFMIAANEAVATRYRRLKRPIIYRVHEAPDPVKLADLGDLSRRLGQPEKWVAAKDGSRFSQPAKATEIAAFSRAIQGCPAEALLARRLLEAQSKARYAAEPLGHFGLALRDYCHFTSPIRRYADLHTHRVIKRQLHGQKVKRHWGKLAIDVAEHVSDTERRASAAEYASLAEKATSYMAGQIGQDFEACISGVMAAGFFVRLDNSLEGFVPFRLCSTYMRWNETLLEVRPEGSQQRYRLGDRVQVRLHEVDRTLRRLTFVLTEGQVGAWQDLGQGLLPFSKGKKKAKKKKGAKEQEGKAQKPVSSGKAQKAGQKKGKKKGGRLAKKSKQKRQRGQKKHAKA